MTTILGIDPGKHTGVAVFHKGQLTELRTTDPSGVAALLDEIQPERVVFEDSRLTRATWGRGVSPAALRKIARNVGQIDAWCTQLVDLCAARGIVAHGISPKGKGAKVSAVEFMKLTGFAGRSNQHQRDAAMVAWPVRGARA
jgi:hypothetical protein